MKTIKCANCSRDILVDDHIYDQYKDYSWGCWSGTAIIGAGRKKMADVVMGESIVLEIDHRDRDIHNCQKENLRYATSSQNKCNQGVRKDSVSGLKGISFVSRKNHWMVRIQAHGKRVSKCFETKEQAIKWYNKTVKEMHGEFAYENVLC